MKGHDMNRYTVYIPAKRKETECKVFAATSFDARRSLVKALNDKTPFAYDITDCVAIRDRGDI